MDSTLSRRHPVPKYTGGKGSLYREFEAAWKAHESELCERGGNRLLHVALWRSTRNVFMVKGTVAGTWMEEHADSFEKEVRALLLPAMLAAGDEALVAAWFDQDSKRRARNKQIQLLLEEIPEAQRATSRFQLIPIAPYPSPCSEDSLPPETDEAKEARHVMILERFWQKLRSDFGSFTQAEAAQILKMEISKGPGVPADEDYNRFGGRFMAAVADIPPNYYRQADLVDAFIRGMAPRCARP